MNKFMTPEQVEQMFNRLRLQRLDLYDIEAIAFEVSPEVGRMMMVLTERERVRYRRYMKWLPVRKTFYRARHFIRRHWAVPIVIGIALAHFAMKLASPQWYSAAYWTYVILWSVLIMNTLRELGCQWKEMWEMYKEIRNNNNGE